MRYREPALRDVAAPPCIWVQSGVLNYRLCDRAYDCESCELFHALRGRAPGTGLTSDRPEKPGRAAPGDDALEIQVADYLSHLLAGCHMYPDRFCAEHFWLLERPGDDVELGLHDHLVRILSPIIDIVALRAGIRLKQGAPCGWITRTSMAFPLSTPISGEITEVNVAGMAALRDRRSRAREDWLLRIASREALADVPGLRRGEEALRWYLDKIKTLKRFLREAICSGPAEALAPMAADGGVPIDDLEQVLGPASFDGLLEQIL